MTRFPGRGDLAPDGVGHGRPAPGCGRFDAGQFHRQQGAPAVRSAVGHAVRRIHAGAEAGLGDTGYVTSADQTVLLTMTTARVTARRLTEVLTCSISAIPASTPANWTLASGPSPVPPRPSRCSWGRPGRASTSGRSPALASPTSSAPSAGRTRPSSLSYSVMHFFANGGGQAVVIRLPVESSVPAASTILQDVGGNTPSLVVTALSSGAASGALFVDDRPLRDRRSSLLDHPGPRQEALQPHVRRSGVRPCRALRRPHHPGR